MKACKALFLIIIVLVGCDSPNTDNTLEDKIDDFLDEEVIPEVKGDFTIFEHDLSMYNEKYLLRIAPSVDSIQNRYSSQIVLTQKSDTIFKKPVNIDSLAQKIIKHEIFPDNPEYNKIGTDYKLRKIVYHGVRTNDLYFEADISSETRQKDLKVLFQISYLLKAEIGKLFVNGFNETGFGPNAGEVESDRNRKITQQFH